MRGFGKSVTVPEVHTELLESTSHARKKCQNSLVNSDEKARKAFSEVFEEAGDFTDDPLPRCHLIITEIHLRPPFTKMGTAVLQQSPK
jgi:hypothetical protein